MLARVAEAGAAFRPSPMPGPTPLPRTAALSTVNLARVVELDAGRFQQFSHSPLRCAAKLRLAIALGLPDFRRVVARLEGFAIPHAGKERAMMKAALAAAKAESLVPLNRGMPPMAAVLPDVSPTPD